MNKRYFSLVMSEDKSEADINIFGDITSLANFSDDSWFGGLKSETDYSAYRLSKQLEEMGNVKKINVHINSYGGEVAEGLAIYNALKNHKAKVVTHCDGFACSIASVIFMAGDERIMSKSSLLMIHNAWMSGIQGNANDLRKTAEDLDIITQASINAYMEHVSISEKELKQLLDKESYLDYKQCIEMGFATSVIGDSKTDKATQNVRKNLIQMILEKQAEDEEETEDEENTNNEDSPKVDKPDTEDEEETNEELDDEEETETSNDEEETETSDEDEENKDDEEEEINANQKAINFFNVISKL